MHLAFKQPSTTQCCDLQRSLFQAVRLVSMGLRLVPLEERLALVWPIRLILLTDFAMVQKIDSLFEKVLPGCSLVTLGSVAAPLLQCKA